MSAKWGIGILAVLIIAGCASQAKTGGASGTAAATAQGFGGDVTVTVTMENGKITRVEADGPNETQGIGSRAITMLPQRMVEQNTVAVDALSGATMTSQGLLEAAKEAAAKINAP